MRLSHLFCRSFLCSWSASWKVNNLGKVIAFLWESVHKFKSMDSEFILLTMPCWFPGFPCCLLISPMGHINLKMECGPWYQNAFFRKIRFKTFLFKYKTYPEKWINPRHSSKDSHSDNTDTAIHQEWNTANTTESLWHVSPRSCTKFLPWAMR